jgi:pimeloyl-[acyl-carrier protein] methyl ester esterase
MKLLFLHGWGFDATLWDGVRSALAPLETVTRDRGYFGLPRNDTNAGPVLAIGHSLGSLLLAADPPPGSIGLVAINGFDRFAGDGAVPLRVVDTMRRRFAETPGVVLDTYRVRCGGAPHSGDLDAQRLADDLDLLASADLRGAASAALVLHGGADPILPPGMRAGVFAGARRETLADAGHLLPLTHPEWCAAMIRQVLP